MRQNDMNYEELIKQAEIHYNAHEDSQAIESDKTKMDGYYWRGLAYRRTYKQDDMLKDADALLVCVPCTAFHFAYRGWAYVVKNEDKQAVEACSEALNRDSSMKMAYYYRAWAYDDLKEFDLAIDDCNKTIEIDPKYANAYNNRGIVYFDKGDLDRAIEDYGKAIDLDPKYATAYINRGDAYSDKGDYDRAIEDHSKAIDLDPKYAKAYYNRGIAYFKKGDYDRAIEDYGKAIDLDPKDAAAYNNRGTAYSDKGDLDRAVEDYSKAIDLDPKNAKAYYNRGTAYSDKGDYDRAIEDYDEAIDLDPENDHARNNRVNAYHAKDKNLTMRLEGIRKNGLYMKELKANISKVVPFLGAGASIPYGYYSWKKLLTELLGRCCRYNKVGDEKRKEIQEYIDSEHYMNAVDEMDIILPSINSIVCAVIERAAEANPIKVVNKRSILSEYLHLFPNKTLLTTNYDTAIEDILKLHEQNTKHSYPTSTLNEPGKSDLYTFFRPETDCAKTIYYLHGSYKYSESIILTKLNYDDYYGIDGDKSSNLRRFLPKKLFDIYHNSIFLYIGCGMAVKEDRILKVLTGFYEKLPSAPSSYALLNVNEVAKTNELFENWGTLNEAEQKTLNKALDEKEDELRNMNIRVIWYSAPENSNDRHESAKRQLLKYILSDTLDEDIIKKKKQTAAEREKQNAEFYNMFRGEDTNDIKPIVESFQRKIRIAQAGPNKFAIAFPMYKIEGELYEIFLVSENGKFYLSDEGKTYAELDRISELKEIDVKKNLDVILK